LAVDLAMNITGDFHNIEKRHRLQNIFDPPDISMAFFSVISQNIISV
jgi:hypothetical protein